MHASLKAAAIHFNLLPEDVFALGYQAVEAKALAYCECNFDLFVWLFTSSLGESFFRSFPQAFIRFIYLICSSGVVDGLVG